MAGTLHPYARVVGGSNTSLHGVGNCVPRPWYLQHEPSSTGFVGIQGGHNLFYRVLGTGPKKMVMVMALAANHTQWEDQFKHFGVERSDEYSVCLLDNRSICWSDSPPGRWRTTDLANDVWCLVENLGWRDIHLVGLSMGGMICLEAALARPDLLSSLTLISTHGGGWGTIPPLHGFFTLCSVFRCSGMSDAIDFGIDVMFPKSFVDSPASKPPLEDYAPPTRRFEIARDILVRKRYYMEAGLENELDLFGVLKQVGAIVTHYISWKRLKYLRQTGIPVLVCSGAQDNLIAWRNSAMLSKALSARHRHFPDGGHCVNEQFKHEVNAAILEVIDAGTAATSAKAAVSTKAEPSMPGLHPGWPLIVAFFSVAYTLYRRLRQGSLGIRPWLVMVSSILTARQLM